MNSSSRHSVCIVTPGYISSTPRVVKEADALFSEGYDVRVVFTQGQLEKIRSYDSDLLKGKPWRCSAVGWSLFRKYERRLYWTSRVRHNLMKKIPISFYGSNFMAEQAEGRVFKELAQLTAMEKADIYIGHYPIGLSAASFAASRWNAKIGYDIEDLHSKEFSESTIPSKVQQRIQFIERKYIASCCHLTAVSELIAQKVSEYYQIKKPVAIYNAFPLSERDSVDGKILDRRGPCLSLYWYSQTVGITRGIQDAIKAVGLLRDKVQLHLRGGISEENKNYFIRLAKECGAEKSIYFHDLVAPRELLSRAVEHDVGLALEPPVTLSIQLTVCNKLFFYMLAGLAIAASDSLGHQQLMLQAPDVGFTYPSGDYQTLVSRINDLILHPTKLEFYKKSSFQAATEMWNWELERKKLIGSIRSVLT